MFVRVTTALVLGVGLIAFAPRWSYADCEFDFITDFNFQITTDNDTRRTTTRARQQVRRGYAKGKQLIFRFSITELISNSMT